MMRWIIGSSLKFGRLVLATAVAALVIGVVQLRDAPVDVYPEFMPPSVQIQTEALGLSAAEVEQLITVPLEQDLLNGVPWLDQIRSESMTGLSSIDLIFEPGTNILRARQMVQERLSQAHALPAVGSPPVMIQPLASTSRVMMIGLSSEDLSLIEMSVLARWKIRPRLMGIPGVANLSIWGQRDRQLQVQIDPERLRRYGVTLDKIVETTGNSLWASPLTFVEASTPGTGGFIDTPNQRFGVQHVFPIATPKELAAVTIAETGGRTLRLGDVASVVEDHQPLIGDAVLDGAPGLMLVIQKFPEANTMEVTREVEAAMAALKPGLSGITIRTDVFRPANFIETALGNIGRAAVIALVLVILLLGFFFLSWRVAVVGGVAIVLSLMAAAYVLYLLGATFNSMVLAGVVVALGAVVGDAVVDIESIRRRLGEHRESGSAEASSRAVVEASLEVRAPMVYATLILLVAAVPVFLLTGVAGAFGRPLASSYALAVLASFAVALTVTPALAFMLLARAPQSRRTSPMARWVERGLDRPIARYVRQPRWAYATLAVLALLSLAFIPQLGSRSLLPASQDRHLLLQLQSAPGTSLQEMDRITATASQELESVRGVRDVGVHVGRAVTSDQVVNVNSGELWISVDPSADYGTTVAAVRRVIDGYPGLRRTLLTYPKDRLNAVRTGSSHPLVVRVYGQDLSVLRKTAEQVRGAVSTVDGVVRPQVESSVEEPTMQIEVNLAAAQRYGIKPGDVRRATATLLSGLLVGNLYEQQKVFDVVVRGTLATRSSLTSVRNLLIDTPGGGQVRLGDIADVRITPYPTVITHDDVSRSLDVSADVSGRDTDAVAQDVNRRLRSLKLPLEYHAEVLGDLARQQSSNTRTLAYVVAAAIAIFLLFQALAGSWRVAALLFLTLPLAGAGGVLTALLTGGIMSAGALLGLLAVLAVTVRNNVLLVRRYQRLRDDGAAPGPDLVLRGTRDMLVPVVLSVLAMGIAFVPFVLFGRVAGAEVLQPLAAVVLGGLVTSTVLTLLVLPALYVRLGPAGRSEGSAPPPPSAPGTDREEERHAAP